MSVITRKKLKSLGLLEDDKPDDLKEAVKIIADLVDLCDENQSIPNDSEALIKAKYFIHGHHDR